jgi:hypothetical protein
VTGYSVRVTENPSRQRNFAPVFFLLAVVVIVFGIAELIHGLGVLVFASDLVLAAVMIALGLRLLRPPTSPTQQRPLRAPRPPR